MKYLPTIEQSTDGPRPKVICVEDGRTVYLGLPESTEFKARMIADVQAAKYNK